jgi:NAD(P)-dependent dehydrogenase (short-subunit alcohol dehydrogenase family)
VNGGGDVGGAKTRTWVVTGASRGIGRAIAARALAMGDRVALLARSDTVMEAASTAEGSALSVLADVTDASSVARAVEDVVSTWGGVDVLVNNAGIHRGGRVDRLAPGDWEDVLATNLTAPLTMARAVLPHMRAGSAIINIGAVVGFRGFPGDAPYGAAKAGLAGLTRVLAVELAPRRIRVNLVVPGFVETEMTGELSERARQLIVERIPLGRTGTAEEIADVVTWVAGSTYMTGSVVATDGGLLAAMGSGR